MYSYVCGERFIDYLYRYRWNWYRNIKLVQCRWFDFLFNHSVMKENAKFPHYALFDKGFREWPTVGYPTHRPIVRDDVIMIFLFYFKNDSQRVLFFLDVPRLRSNDLFIWDLKYFENLRRVFICSCLSSIRISLYLELWLLLFWNNSAKRSEIVAILFFGWKKIGPFIIYPGYLNEEVAAIFH